MFIWAMPSRPTIRNRFWPHRNRPKHSRGGESLPEFVGRRLPLLRQAPLAAIPVPKYFRGESFDGGAALPGIPRQSGFQRDLLEKRNPVPALLDRHLRQQQAAAPVA